MSAKIQEKINTYKQAARGWVVVLSGLINCTNADYYMYARITTYYYLL